MGSLKVVNLSNFEAQPKKKKKKALNSWIDRWIGGFLKKEEAERESERVENVTWNCGGITRSQRVLRYVGSKWKRNFLYSPSELLWLS